MVASTAKKIIRHEHTYHICVKFVHSTVFNRLKYFWSLDLVLSTVSAVCFYMTVQFSRSRGFRADGVRISRIGFTLVQMGGISIRNKQSHASKHIRAVWWGMFVACLYVMVTM